MSYRILFVLTSQRSYDDPASAAGSWLEELAAPYFVLADAGHQVTLASIKGGEAPLDPASLQDPWITDAGRRFLGDAALMAQLASTPALADVDDGDYDAVFMVGGAAVMWDFPNDPALGALLGRVAQSGRVYGGVCHGVAGLLNRHAPAGLVAGRNLTCISNQEDQLAGFDGIVPFMPEDPLREAGGKLSFAGEPFGANAVRDGNLVTGQNPASAAGCGTLLIEAIAEYRAARGG